MKLDEKFYQWQTQIRGMMNPSELEMHCKNEFKRLGRIIKRTNSFQRITNQTKALDIPCGYGNILYAYKMLGINSIGYDQDQNQIILATSLGLNAEKNNFFEIDFDMEAFDLITSFDFIEHLEKNEALEVLMKFNNILVQDGTLVLRTPCGDSPFGLKDFSDDPTHKWIGSSSCIVSMLKIAGFNKFEVQEDWPIYGKLNFVRKILRKMMRPVILMLLIAAGYSRPACLSSSMIIYARK